MHGGQQRLQLRSAKVRPLALSPILLRGRGHVFFLRAFLRAFGVDARRWLRWILNPSRRSFKLRVLVDRQRPMKNVTLDRTTVLQLDANGTDSALDAAADCNALRNDVALDLCAIADQKISGAQLAFDSAQDLRWTITIDLADDRHVGADARAYRRVRRRLPPRRDDQVLLLHRPPHAFGRICRRVLILLRCFALEHVYLRFPPAFTANRGKAILSRSSAS